MHQNRKGLPILCLDKKFAYLFGPSGNLILTLELGKILEAVLALIGVFYLFDVDYPPTHEPGLTMLHNMVFKDLNDPADLIKVFEAAKEKYLDFKSSI